MAYPDNLPDLTNPVATDKTSNPSHAAQHTNANNEIEAICTELGTLPKGSYGSVKLRLNAIDAHVSNTTSVHGLTIANVTQLGNPAAGIVLSTGSAWGTSITNNSTNWNTAYSWGNHASAGYLTAVVADSPLSGAGTAASHLTVDLSSKQNLHANLTSVSGLIYASASFVKMTGANTFSLDTNTYLTGNQTITLSGDVSGSGATSITTTIGNSKVTEAMLNTSDNTTANMSTSKHGFAPKGNNDATYYLDGTGVWSVPAGGGGGGANTALSNLASVAINTSLVSDTDDTDDLGSSSKKWKDLYVDGVAYCDQVEAPIISDSATGELSLRATANVTVLVDSDNDTSGIFYIKKGLPASPTTLVTVQSTNGYMGIGAAPQHLLTLSGAVGSNRMSIIRTDSATASGGIFFLGSDNVSDWNIGTNLYIGSGFEISEGAEPGTSNRFYMSNGGALRLTNYGAGTATFDASGNITSVSDIRLKDIQGDYQRSLAEILAISPILFKYKKETGLDTENIYVGFSAQEVMKYIPEAIGVDSKDYYTFNDKVIIATLVNAVKELQKEIDELKKVNNLPIEKYKAVEEIDDSKVTKYKEAKRNVT
jgi:hypothetical protein